MMDTYVFTNLIGSEGLFTFNFFCESLIGSLHTLHHIMEDKKMKLPPQANELSDALAEMGSNLLQDYSENKLDLHRFKQELLDFYELAFAVNDEVAPLILKGDHTLQYYYYVYMQGVNLFYPNIMQSILRDVPANADFKSCMDEIAAAFAALTTPKQTN